MTLVVKNAGLCVSPLAQDSPLRNVGLTLTGTYSREPRELAGWEDGRPVERNPGEGLKGGLQVGEEQSPALSRGAGFSAPSHRGLGTGTS